MKYLKIQWLQLNKEYPVLIYSELDNLRMETRKIEVWSDGHMEHADSTESSINTKLGKVPTPELTKIAADPQFKPIEISKSDFEAIWDKRK